jgi:hypothetical protein
MGCGSLVFKKFWLTIFRVAVYDTCGGWGEMWFRETEELACFLNWKCHFTASDCASQT